MNRGFDLRNGGVKLAAGDFSDIELVAAAGLLEHSAVTKHFGTQFMDATRK